MDDLSKLRSAIANKNDGEVKKIQQSHITKIPSPKFPMKCNDNEAKKIDLFEIYTKLLNIFENCIHKNDILKVRIMCQEIARIQDFAPFTPELLGALRDPWP